MEQKEKDEHKLASWALVNFMRYLIMYGLWIMTKIFNFCLGREASFWASDDYTGWVDFEARLTWQVVSKLVSNTFITNLLDGLTCRWARSTWKSNWGSRLEHNKPSKCCLHLVGQWSKKPLQTWIWGHGMTKWRVHSIL